MFNLNKVNAVYLAYTEISTIPKFLKNSYICLLFKKNFGIVFLINFRVCRVSPLHFHYQFLICMTLICHFK